MRKTSVILSVAILAVGLIWLGCGKDQPLSSGEESSPMARLAKPAGVAGSMHRAVVVATLTQDGAPVEGAEVALSRSISGQAADYRWKGTTDREVGRQRNREAWREEERKTGGQGDRRTPIPVQGKFSLLGNQGQGGTSIGIPVMNSEKRLRSSAL